MNKKDLTNSDIHRQNIINNDYAIAEIQQQVALEGILIDGTWWYTKKQVAAFYEVDERTINRYLKNHGEELKINGYELLKGYSLQKFKKKYKEMLENRVKDINVPNPNQAILKRLNDIPTLGIFSFKSFLNIGMLLTESAAAKELRSLMLNIVLDVFHQKLGGKTTYINQSEEQFLDSATREFNYRKVFTDALGEHILANKFKYAHFTDLIYKSIFREDAKEYKQILKLDIKATVKDTLYSEVLDLVASYENGFADELEKAAKTKGSPLTMSEARTLFVDFESRNQSLLLPLVEKARTLMASRDMVFRDALHFKLEKYIKAIDQQEFDKFLGEKSEQIRQVIEENIDVYKRLKDR